MFRNKSKKTRKVTEDENANPLGSTLAHASPVLDSEAEPSFTHRVSRKVKYGFLDVFRASRSQSTTTSQAPTAGKMLQDAKPSDLAITSEAMMPATIVRDDPGDDVTAKKKGMASETHFFKDATNFKIQDMQINSAGRDVHVSNVTTNYLEDHSLGMIAYAEGAGIDTTKACLYGTRTDILTEIKAWITTTAVTAPRVFWLSGPAGTGKSAIAHTIARWWILEDDVKGVGSCFCFNRQVTTRREKLFSTIACDLAGRIPGMKDRLIQLVASEPALATTSDVAQQWRRLIVEPIGDLPGTAKPIVIVIDALDESGEAISRRHILSILSNDAVALPSSFRILVTSRPLPDINSAFHDTDKIRHLSMDQFSRSSTERDIHLYISYQLRDIDDDFDDEAVSQLTRKSDGLFEWARLACEHIKYADDFLTNRERFEQLIVHSGEGEALLDNTYLIILRSIMGDRPNNLSLDRYRSVLRLVLSTREPLAMVSLDVLHSNMSYGYHAAVILQRFGSLLSGISNQAMPVRTLHSTFYEFLTAKDRSGPFFVDLKGINLELAQACLRVMEQHLCFNICGLESSYLRNSEVADLGQRIKTHIKTYLSYSCQFWADHIKSTPYQTSLADQISAFLLSERMLFWLEVLGLLNVMNLAPIILGNVAGWLQGNNHEKVVAVARDGIKFSRMIGGISSESTPHLYLSGLPFLPQNSSLSRYLTPKFHRMPRIASGNAAEWPILQLSIKCTAGISSVAFSPDGKRIVSGSWDKTFCVWDAETGMQVGSPFKGHTDGVRTVAFSPDGKMIASGSDDETLCIWDAETGVQVFSPLKGHSGSVRSVAFSPNGKRIVSGSEDETVCLWDAETGMQVSSPLKGHTFWVRSVVFSPDGKWIASGSSDDTICIWDAETGVQEGSSFEGTSAVYSLAFSIDGKRIVSGSEHEDVSIWDVEAGVQVGKLRKGHTNWVRSVIVSPDGKRIASASSDTTICIWDAEAGVQIGNSLKGHTFYVNSIAFSPDGKRIVSGSDDKTICIWDAETVVQVSSPPKGHTEWVRSVAFSPDGKRIASGSDDKTICIWDAETGEQVGILKGHSHYITSVAFSPDCKRIISGSWDQTVCIWDSETGEQVGYPLEGHTGWVHSIAFSLDGNKIASGSHDETVCIWDAKTGVKAVSLPKVHSGPVRSVSFSPDGRRLASSSSDCTVCIWDTETGEQLCSPLKGHTDDINSVAFSPDGKRIASGSSDQTICIWDVITGAQIGSPLEGHSGAVFSVAFSPSGERIASGSNDKIVHIWDTKTGLQVCRPIEIHTGTVYSVAFSPDGKRIVSGSADHTICIWDADNDDSMENLKCHTQENHPPTSSKASSIPDAETTRAVNLEDAIKFSYAREHALHNPSQLFENTPEAQLDWRHHIFRNSQGWITGPQGRLLMWVPPAYQTPLLLPKMRVIIPHPVIELDLSMMAHGCMWSECYKG